MADAFDPIAKTERTAWETKSYNEPRYEKPTDIHAISNNSNKGQRGSFNRHQGTYKNNNGNNRSNSQNNPPRQSSSKEPVCYHSAALHYITKCAQYQKYKDKHECTTQQVKQNYENRLKLGAKKNNICINEAYFKNKEDDNPGDYSEEQVLELCKLLDTNSE